MKLFVVLLNENVDQVITFYKLVFNTRLNYYIIFFIRMLFTTQLNNSAESYSKFTQSYAYIA